LIWIDREREAEFCGDELSRTLTVNVYVPCRVGVPLIPPVAASSCSPCGRLPAVIDHVYGAVPPVAARVAAYAWCTAPDGRDVVVIETGAAATAMLRDPWAVCWGDPPSAAWTVKEYVPGDVGVPLMPPVAASSERPGGRLPVTTDQEYGGVPPLPASVAVYELPTLPPGREVVLTANRDATAIDSAWDAVSGGDAPSETPTVNE
jgi:hypothetical protein